VFTFVKSHVEADTDRIGFHGSESGHIFVHQPDGSEVKVTWQVELVIDVVVLDPEFDDVEVTDVLGSLGVTEFLVTDLSHVIDEFGTVALAGIFLSELREERQFLDWTLTELECLDDNIS
jgi:hypothetical protein